MAWVDQIYTVRSERLAWEFFLGGKHVEIGTAGGPSAGQRVVPTTREEAHELAMVFRKMARRLEEIGLSLPPRGDR